MGDIVKVILKTFWYCEIFFFIFWIKWCQQYNVPYLKACLPVQHIYIGWVNRYANRCCMDWWALWNNQTNINAPTTNAPPSSVLQRKSNLIEATFANFMWKPGKGKMKARLLNMLVSLEDWSWEGKGKQLWVEFCQQACLGYCSCCTLCFAKAKQKEQCMLSIMPCWCWWQRESKCNFLQIICCRSMHVLIGKGFRKPRNEKLLLEEQAHPPAPFRRDFSNS